MSQKPKVSLIVAMAQGNVIGDEGKLPWHFKKDMAHFKKMTLGKTVIMGRKTWESLGKPLKGRLNLVVSKTLPESTDYILFPTFIEALNFAKKTEPVEVIVIGGGAIYEESLPYVTTIYETFIDHEYDGDTFFKDIFNWGTLWKEVSSETKTENDIDLIFTTWVRK